MTKRTPDGKTAMQIVASRTNSAHCASIRPTRRTGEREDIRPINRALLKDGSVTLSVSGALRSQIDANSADAVTLFHHGPTGQCGDTALTISLLGDGTIRAIHRCDGDRFELRGGRVPFGKTVTVAYRWGEDGSHLMLDGAEVDSSLAVLSLPKAPDNTVTLHLERRDDRLVTPTQIDPAADSWGPTEMTM